MKKSVILNFTHNYEIDVKGLCNWADENLGLKTEMYNNQWISLYKEGDLTSTEQEGYKSQEQYDLEQYYLGLTEEGEQSKLLLPSRLEGEELQAWENTKKAEIAAITDFSALTEAQKKLWMGLPLTDEEKDGLEE